MRNTLCAPQTTTSKQHIRGINSIRALCAGIVLLSHIDLFPQEAIHSSSRMLSYASRLSLLVWNGHAAVIVFFLVSSFCIHLPFRRNDRVLEPFPFLSRRLLRLGLPAAVVVLIARLVGGWGAFSGVSWSILCEAIYYLIYPVLLPLSRRYGWFRMIAVAYGASGVLVLLHLRTLAAASDYMVLGPWLTWLVGLPVWMLGCLLCEMEGRFPALSAKKMFSLRVTVFLLSCGIRVLKFHAHGLFASNILTLNTFAGLVFFWLGCEVAYYKVHKPISALEWVGSWSYSIYLVHTLTAAVLTTLGVTAIFDSERRAHLLFLVLAFAFSYVFYRTVESPSHKIAIAVSRIAVRGDGWLPSWQTIAARRGAQARPDRHPAELEAWMRLPRGSEMR